ncbi:MAG: DNA polymerase/3'-5' exonuclease PolX [Candidatus Omnitrophica bacterium]|nr:DNA polymerase/3'-5' exonuclease PolX [Candidatus Omnitrophota bacterium]MCM8828303.1 DNA polymerase/3'-5' exonuclease PolX [Candidatus Omnitrophota bacterium]
MKNNEIADLFDEIADVLEFTGDSVFKINAYRKAARRIREASEDIEQLYQAGQLSKIPGIGKGIAEHIEEYLKTGRISKYKNLISEIPPTFVEMMKIPNLGPKTLKLIYDNFKIQTIDDLKSALEKEEILALPGMGEKKVENIKKGIKLYLSKKTNRRISLGIALPVVFAIVDYMKPVCQRISPCGSLRRMKETIGDIDILCAADDKNKVMEHFVNYPARQSVIAKGETKGSIIVRDNLLQADLRVVESSSYGAALQYFTGSKDHNIKLRAIAKEKELKINEYGVFRGDTKIVGETEEGVYEVFGMPFIAPELREDRGEIEAAIEGKLPILVEEKDILGDMHVHTNFSDGTSAIEEIVKKAISMGYKFVGLADHSQTSKFAGGLTVERLRERNKEIDRISKKYPGITILKAAEVDILGDGKLDYPDEILAELDFVIGSIHQGFKKNVTERMIAAMENRYLDIIGHPTGRLISSREGYDVDIDRVIEHAAKTGTILEINAYYDRLDLNDTNVFKAREKKVMVSIGTDAHNTRMMEYMKLGVGVARRGWLEKHRIINCYPVREMLVKRKRV